MAEIDIAARGGIHKYLIARFLSEFPEAQTGSFMKALRSIPGADYMAWLFAETDWVKQSRIIPDAYIIDAERRCVVVYEAVVGNDIDPHKLGRLMDLAFALDEDEWELALVRETQLYRRTYAPIALYPVVAAHRMKTGGNGIPRDWINHYVDPASSTLSVEVV